MTNKMKNVPELRFPEFIEEWEEKRLGEVTIYKNGGSFENSVKNHGIFKLITLKSVNTEGKLINSGKYIDDKSTETLCKGTLVMILSEQAPGLVGMTANITRNNKYVLNQRVAALVPKQGTDSQFLSKLINRNQKYFSVRSAGTKVKNISKGHVENFNFLSPNYTEQQKIGSFFSKLDQQIELEEEKLEKLEEQKKGYMQKIFSQEIRFKDDNGNSYPKWEPAPLFDIFSATKGKSLSKDKISNDGKYECILYGEIYTTYAEKIESIVSRTNYYEGILSQKNDLIFPNSTTTNAWDLATFSSLQKNNVLIGGDISILRTKRSDISSLFYAYYLTNYLKLRKDIAKYAQGITIVHLSFNNFCKIKVQIPSLEEQNSITDFIDSLNQQQKLITNKIKLLKKRKKGFLQKMFV